MTLTFHQRMAASTAATVAWVRRHPRAALSAVVLWWVVPGPVMLSAYGVLCKKIPMCEQVVADVRQYMAGWMGPSSPARKPNSPEYPQTVVVQPASLRKEDVDPQENIR